MDGAEAPASFRGERANAREIAHVRRDRDGADLRGRALQGARLDVGDRNPHALGEQLLGDAAAEARGAARHDRRSPAKARERAHEPRLRVR